MKIESSWCNYQSHSTQMHPPVRCPPLIFGFWKYLENFPKGFVKENFHTQMPPPWFLEKIGVRGGASELNGSDSGKKRKKTLKITKLCPTKNTSENVFRWWKSISNTLSTCKNMFSTLFWKFWGKSWHRSLWLLAPLWKIHRGAKSQSDRSQLFSQNFQNNVENMFLHVLSVFKTDFHHLNTFSDVFLVGQSLVISSVFYVFPHYYTLL